jgi:5-hydroxyisourate hydrolase-like protein (transthyretin family)
MKIRALTAVALSSLLWGAPAEAAPPPMMDPSAMSGIPRPDPKLPAGTVTVRCLGKAGFSAPAVDTEVTLEVTAADGSVKTFTAKTQAQGRATFDQLSELIGSTAVAKVTLGGAEVASGSIPILPQTGTAVMLVEGASAKAAAPPPARPGGEPAIPAPGNAFALDGMAVGTLTIGTFDLDARKPVANVVVKLTITPPEGEPVVRELTTDGRGKAVFEDLMPPTTPEGATLTAEAMLVAGGTLRKSQPFTMSTEKGMALVLAEGAEQFQSGAAAAPAQGQPPQRAERRPLPGPRILRTLPSGSVRISLWDAADQPIASQKVMVVKKAATGAVQKFRAVSGPDGTVVIPDVPVRGDSLYFVESIYGNAPFQSSFFGMDERGGIDVQMRLFETTNDPSVVRSAVQYDIVEGENDLAQVVQVFEVMVDGDKAFWDPELRIESMDGSKGFTVLRPAEAFLDHTEKAPFATLHGPIPPGKLTNLSVGYLIEHSGSVDLRWVAPFDLMQASVLVDENFELEAPGKKLGDHASPIPGRTVWTLNQFSRGETVSFTMNGLRHRDPTLKKIGWGGLAGFGLVALFGLLRKRPSRKDQLLERRERLLQELEAAGGDAARTDALVSELDRVVRQLEVLQRTQSAA